MTSQGDNHPVTLVDEWHVTLTASGEVSEVEAERARALVGVALWASVAATDAVLGRQGVGFVLEVDQ